MRTVSSIKPNSRQPLLLRLRLLSLLKRFPLRDSEVRWTSINHLFFLAAIPISLLGLYFLGNQIQGYCDLYSDLCTDDKKMPLSNFWQYRWFVKSGLSEFGSITNLALGLAYLIPLLFICFAVCRFWDWLFVRFFNHCKDGGNLLISFLFVLLLPLTIPLGYALVGISFGIVFGKLVFGGNGRYLVNPALLGILFLNYSYPSLFSAQSAPFVSENNGVQSIWQLLANGGSQLVNKHDFQWLQVFVGGEGHIMSISSASALACLFGLVLLMTLRKEYWLVPCGAIVGLLVASTLLNSTGGSAVPHVEWYWHLIVGNFAFCLAFIATDPTVLPTSQLAKFIYGILFSFLTLLIRIATPSHPEGTLTALLLASLLIPVVDWIVIESHRKLKKRKRRLRA